jgi:predicted dehydrogenase
VVKENFYMKLRAGVIGTNRGQAFANALLNCEHTEMAAICDINPEILQKNKDIFGNPALFTDYRRMLESGIDMVIVAAPLPLHVPISIEALDMGIHVFSEVPAASSLEQCGDLVQAVRRSKAKYMFGENCCYMKNHMIVKEMARAGVFGDIYYAEGEYVHNVRFRDEPGGWREKFLFDRRGGTYQTHSLGPILEWLDDIVVTVNCVGSGSHVDPRIHGDDSSVMLCTTAKGALISLRNDVLSPRPFSGYASLQGTNGCYETDWSTSKYSEMDRVALVDPEKPKEDVTFRPLSDFEKDFTPKVWRDLPEGADKWEHGGADPLAIMDFVHAILEDREPPIDVYRGLDFTVPGLISEISANQGGAPVAVPNFRYR